MEIWRIGITLVGNNNSLEDNITYVGATVTDRGVYDGKV